MDPASNILVWQMKKLENWYITFLKFPAEALALC